MLTGSNFLHFLLPKLRYKKTVKIRENGKPGTEP